MGRCPLAGSPDGAGGVGVATEGRTLVQLARGSARGHSRATPAAQRAQAAKGGGRGRAPGGRKDATIAVAVVRAIHEGEEWFGEGSAFASTEKLATALRELADRRQEASAPATALQPPLSAERPAADPRETLFRSVMAAGGITPLYQPIVDLTDGRLVGAQAAVRFGSGEASQWFAEAAEAGLGGDLEIAAALTALGGLAALSRRAYLCLSFSASTLLRSDATELLRKAPLTRVVVEIRLNQSGFHLGDLTDALRPLREGGLRIAVDAGGAGTLSLRQLARLAPDIVKIDTPTILGPDSEASERALGRVVIAFAERSGTSIVGARVENQRDLPQLRDLGVRYGQGFLLARPGALPVDEKPIVELIGKGTRRPIWTRRFPPPWSPL